MTSNYSLMNTSSPAKSLPPIYAADGNCMNITHIGTINAPSLNLSHTYCVPNLNFNLVSVGQLCDLGLTVSFSPNGCQVQDPQTGQTIGMGRKVGRLFEFLSLQGTLVQRSCTHTSQQNGRAERKHRHILDSVRPFLLSASCPEKFWSEAALTSVYTINRLPSSVLQNISPFERLYGTPPNYSNLKTFGCACFVLLHPHEHIKLESRALLCCFLGYGTEHKGFCCWDPLSNRLRISRHVTFWEHTMFSRLSSFHASFSSPQPLFTNISLTFFLSLSPLLVMSLLNLYLLRQPRTSRPSLMVVLNLLQTPLLIVLLDTDPLWQKAMNDELQALEKTHTLNYVDLPTGKRPIGCKWIYKIKTHCNGTIERYKTRLVAKEYSQEYGIDYEETFASMARMTSVHSLLAVAAVKQWPLLQMDVKNAFLNGTLSEEAYMKPPPSTFSSPHKVCLLRRALYGLKQAPRAWFATFSSTITQFGFTSSPHDTALFTRHTL
ncbi:hypothetical protein IC575_002460 [Cucumis melo]